MSPTQTLFSFRGRVGRITYWLYSLGVSMVMVSVAFCTQLVVDAIAPASGIARVIPPYEYLVVTIGIIFLWPLLAVQAKRWHDVDKSAWWILVNLAPVAGPMVTLVFCGLLPGSPGQNRFGQPPGNED